MSRQVFFCSVYLTVWASLLSVISCSKTANTAPAVIFNSTSPYVYPDTVLVYGDTTLTHGAHFFVSVSASKSGLNQLLTNAIFYKSVNGGPDTVFYQIPLTGPYLNAQYFFVAGDSGNAEKYTFTFTQTNGLIGSDSLVIKNK